MTTAWRTKRSCLGDDSVCSATWSFFFTCLRTFPKDGVPRLAEMMQAATMKQNENKLEKDLESLEKYFAEKQLVANRQAGGTFPWFRCVMIASCAGQPGCSVFGNAVSTWQRCCGEDDANEKSVHPADCWPRGSRCRCAEGPGRSEQGPAPRTSVSVMSLLVEQLSSRSEVDRDAAGPDRLPLSRPYVCVTSVCAKRRVCSGALLVDEGLEVARCICNGNMSAILLVMLPMAYTSGQQTAVIKNRRAVEDKLLVPL